jgi:hypothetical protein
VTGTELRRIVDTLTGHTHSCQQDRTDLIAALDAALQHAITCRHIERDLLIELAGQVERTRMDLVINEDIPPRRARG